jgi:hypothetical protein
MTIKTPLQYINYLLDVYGIEVTKDTLKYYLEYWKVIKTKVVDWMDVENCDYKIGFYKECLLHYDERMDVLERRI